MPTEFTPVNSTQHLEDSTDRSHAPHDGAQKARHSDAQVMEQDAAFDSLQWFETVERELGDQVQGVLRAHGAAASEAQVYTQLRHQHLLAGGAGHMCSRFGGVSLRKASAPLVQVSSAAQSLVLHHR